ncbi:AraC family transcriptional regulator [Larkinella knui]|uniref:AraC family transcriptional regulator n=1 Tax=Larkinella knui TaxID=2025310 RepID=A0A3P1CBK1_9BACT|nr:AraC family transcriptional regulator [Larkinella knui]RRB10628.1 AraC family transcriptional regulator [Larkinella knui]
MKALFEKIELGDHTSLRVTHVRLPYFDAPWHFHPEYELTYIIRSHGKRFVGDHIEPFYSGDLVLLGPDLPHFWRNDDEYYHPDSDQQAEAIVVQFSRTLGDTVLPQLPETQPLIALLNQARYGLRFGVEKAADVKPALERLLLCDGLERLLRLLYLLQQLTDDPNAVMLASDNYELKASEAETERMKRVLDFMLAHFREEIRVDDMASVAGMAPAAFCRYFRKRTRKSFIEYLNELRISHARKLLVQSDLSISQVGLECGFNNISHFHRQFKLHNGTTPLKYQSLQHNK